MELRHLEYFATVAAERGFGRAAAHLHIAQSAVSAAVRALEGELGVELIDRSRRQITLTSAGELLLPKAQAAIDLAQEIRDTAKEFDHGSLGTVRMGVMTSVRLIDVPDVLGRLRHTHPGITVSLRVSPDGSTGLAERLVAGEFDVALVALPSPPSDAVRLEPIASSPIVLVVPATHRLAGGDAALADLAGEDFVELPRGYGLRRITDDAFAAAGVYRTPALEVADVGTVAQYVGHGLGVALLPEFVARAQGAVIVPLRDPLPDFVVAIATSSQRRVSAAVAAVVHGLRAHGVAREPAPDTRPSRAGVRMPG